MTSRVLYLSQMAPPHLIERWRLPREEQTIPPVFDELGAAVTVADVIASPPPDPEPYDGVVVGGSTGSATDRDDWRRDLETWFRRHAHVPVLCICGGHQAMAVAFGGTIERLSSRQVGVYPVELTGVPDFAGEVVQSHGEGVERLPEGASVWSRDELCVQALRYEGPVPRWSVQFHPEVSADSARRLFASFKKDPDEWPDERLAGALSSGRAVLRAWLAEV